MRVQSQYDRWLTTPPDEYNPIVGEDWQGNLIQLTDNDEYIDIDGDLVLNDKDELQEYLTTKYDVINTYSMEE